MNSSTPEGAGLVELMPELSVFIGFALDQWLVIRHDLVLTFNTCTDVQLTFRVVGFGVPMQQCLMEW